MSSTDESKASRILESGDGIGGLFLGGFKSVNETFVKEEGVKGVVNIVGPSLFKSMEEESEKTYKDTIQSAEIELRDVSWDGGANYRVSDEDLEMVLRHIHKIRTAGGSVIVHCTQGRSRASTAAIAYVMARDMKSCDDALAFVKERREVAQPSGPLMERLKEFEKSELIVKLHREFTEGV